MCSLIPSRQDTQAQQWRPNLCRAARAPGPCSTSTRLESSTEGSHLQSSLPQCTAPSCSPFKQTLHKAAARCVGAVPKNHPGRVWSWGGTLR